MTPAAESVPGKERDNLHCRPQLCGVTLKWCSPTQNPYDPKEQASYIQSWIKVLKNDENEVWRWLSFAQFARHRINGRGAGRRVAT